MFACIFRVDFRKEQFQHKVARQKERKEEQEREREETEERLEALREKVLHFSRNSQNICLQHDASKCEVLSAIPLCRQGCFCIT